MGVCGGPVQRAGQPLVTYKKLEVNIGSYTKFQVSTKFIRSKIKVVGDFMNALYYYFQLEKTALISGISTSISIRVSLVLAFLLVSMPNMPIIPIVIIATLQCIETEVFSDQIPVCGVQYVGLLQPIIATYKRSQGNDPIENDLSTRIRMQEVFGQYVYCIT
jgi:hypothetical protein